MRQSSLVVLSRGYVVSFSFIAGSDDELDELIEKLYFPSRSPEPCVPQHAISTLLTPTKIMGYLPGSRLEKPAFLWYNHIELGKPLSTININNLKSSLGRPKSTTSQGPKVPGDFHGAEWPLKRL